MERSTMHFLTLIAIFLIPGIVFFCFFFSSWKMKKIEKKLQKLLAASPYRREIREISINIVSKKRNYGAFKIYLRNGCQIIHHFFSQFTQEEMLKLSTKLYSFSPEERAVYISKLFKGALK